MIQITVDSKKNSITVEGHAGYGVSGTDIVCASVSSILITTVNAILRVDDASIQLEQKDAYVNVTVLKHSKMVDLLIENMISLFEELQKDYKKYVKVNKGGAL